MAQFRFVGRAFLLDIYLKRKNVDSAPKHKVANYVVLFYRLAHSRDAKKNMCTAINRFTLVLQYRAILGVSDENRLQDLIAVSALRHTDCPGRRQNRQHTVVYQRIYWPTRDGEPWDRKTVIGEHRQRRWHGYESQGRCAGRRVEQLLQLSIARKIVCTQHKV